MVKFLIATHGFLAEGFKSSVSVLMGEEIAASIETVNAFVENGTEDPKGAIEKICSKVNETDDLVIFTDLMFGSVNQFVTPFVSKKNIFAVTGVNFPLICEIISKLTFGIEESRVTEEELHNLILKSRNQMMLVEDVDKKDVVSDDDFFE